ncbi:dipeptide/oligopeptide/nickel ABC transporter permease/ATP-binding protein [Rhodococcus ruber]|uniref:Dipeptide/oligopeptide/nickel ABC transporter permease/ATP-binding protein n=2 Tax=Rhodococcus ruber TaxID=1830 RepID=A0ABT4MMS6_9NOCA|nr:dipeptide/oligopeptide/nickel ABC transporter permease/ATP-binding protein [Rhodococcus ruber]MCZ4522300.1 dipeptide/oligopeptide/nickel ABC transporter permease/ATP-binding protein [Rhodococcus ruber]
MGVTATSIALLLGVLLGASLVVAGHRTTWIGSRVIDLWLALPPIIVALCVTAIFGPSQLTVIVAVGLAFCPQFARLTNTLAKSVAQRDFVTTSRLLGVSPSRVLFRHILPNIASPIMVLTSVCLATSVIMMSGLSFIGLGVQPPSIDWGQLLASGIRDINQNPSAAIAPSLMIVLTGLSASLLGDGVVAASDPRLARRRDRSSSTSDEPTSFHTRVDDDDTPKRDDVLVIDNLRIASGDSDLVKGVSIRVGSGETVGLVGESGSGKSLTAMAAARLLPTGLRMEADRLACAGHSMGPTKTAPIQLALDLGVVFQDPSSCFNPARKLGPQLTESIRVHTRVDRKTARRMAVRGLEEVRVTDPERRLHQYPHEMSGGMRQRAMIAMALMSNPKLLIADEPTTALDVTVQADVLRLIQKVGRDHGMSVLLISHDIDVVAAMCDRMYVAYQGRIVEHLTAQQLRDRRVSHPYTKRLLDASSNSALNHVIFRDDESRSKA